MHLNDDGRHKDYKIIAAVIPDDLRIIELSPDNLPAGWDSDPPIYATRDIGTEWVKSGKSAILKVPSVIVQGEVNYIVNPKHRDFPKIRVHIPVKFHYDPRMWRKERQ